MEALTGGTSFKGSLARRSTAWSSVTQLRTIDLDRVTATTDGAIQHLTDPDLRRDVRGALARHLGLDMPFATDGGTSP